MEFLGNVTNCGAETPFRLKIFNTWNIKSLILKSTLLGWGLKHCDKQWNPHCKFYKEIFFRFWNKLRVHWNTWGGTGAGTPHANINSIRQPFTPPISVLLHLIEYRGNTVYIQICLQWYTGGYTWIKNFW